MSDELALMAFIALVGFSFLGAAIDRTRADIFDGLTLIYVVFGLGFVIGASKAVHLLINSIALVFFIFGHTVLATAAFVLGWILFVAIGVGLGMALGALSRRYVPLLG